MTGAVILAAGSSSRMGSPKQILPFRGISLLRRAALAALNAGCSPVVVVTGAHAELSRRELDGLDVREALNPRWETGMASSIGAGLAVLQLILGNFVDPRIEGRHMSISPMIVLLSIVFWAWVWGPIGALLGVPVTVTPLCASTGSGTGQD